MVGISFTVDFSTLAVFSVTDGLGDFEKIVFVVGVDNATGVDFEGPGVGFRGSV